MARFSKADLRWFKRAKEEAEKSDYKPFKLGCVLVYKGHILSTGHNQVKTNPLQEHYNKYRNFRPGTREPLHSIHAELDAINSVPYEVDKETDWSKVKVYIYRISPGRKTGRGVSRPCRGCSQLIMDKGIKHVYYTGNDSYVYERYG